MAYHRGDTYIWSGEAWRGEDGVHFWDKEGNDGWAEAGWGHDENGERLPGYENASGVSITGSVVNEFVAMRFAQMLADGSALAAMERAARVGNVGGATLAKNLAVLTEALAASKIEPWGFDEPFPKFPEDKEKDAE